MSTQLTEQPVLPQIYANLSQCSASPSDISITLGISGTAPLGSSDNAPPIQLAVVRLSPSSAKMLFLNLQQMLTVYETRFSKIYVPKEFQDAIRDADIQLGIAPDADTRSSS